MASTSPLKSFWDALNKGKDEDAMRALRLAALPGPAGAPSPRVAELIKSGEWDSSMKLPLICLKEGACAGLVNDDPHRFCGRYNCPTAAHGKGSKTAKPGWYIPAGVRSSNGLFTTPWLPLESDGGPVKGRAAALINDGTNPFRLNREQWKFVMEGWAEMDQGASAENPTGSSATPGSESVQSWEDVAKAGTGMGSIQEPLVIDTSLQDPASEARESGSTNQLSSQMAKLMDTVTELTERVATLEIQLEEASSEVAYFKGQVRDLLPRTYKLERMAQQTGMGTGGTSFRSGQMDLATLIPEVESLKLEMYSEQGRVAHLRVLYNQLKERQDTGTGIAIGNYRFTSKNELLAWYDARNPQVGVFMDAHAMMHAVPATHATIADTMKLFEAQKRVEHKNELETVVRTSFKTIVPSVFIGSNTIVDNSTFSALKSAIKDYNAWKPPQTRGTGVSKRIEDGVMTVDRRIQELRNQLSDDAEVQGLSNLLTRDSLLFVNQLCRFMEEQHILYSDTSYTASQIWDMQLECLQTILEELDAARRPFADAAEFVPGLYLWAMLQAWKIQQRYMSNSFRDDPALTGVFVRRVLMSSEDKVLVAKVAKVDSLEKTVAENHRNYTAQIKKLQEQLAQMKPK